VRLNRGGTQTRISPEEVDALLAHLCERVWPHVPSRREAERALDWWGAPRVWNIAPDDHGRVVSPALRRCLHERYLSDAMLLRDLIGVEPPWAAAYEFALGRGAYGAAA